MVTKKVRSLTNGDFGVGFIGVRLVLKIFVYFGKTLRFSIVSKIKNF